jgi:nitroreductase
VQGVGDFFEVVGSRASVRRFRPNPVPDEAIKRILWAATRAPTAGGRENWFFVVVKSEEARREVHRLLIEAHLRYAVEIARDGKLKDVVLSVYDWRRLSEIIGLKKTRRTIGGKTLDNLLRIELD